MTASLPLEDEFGDIIGKARFGLKRSPRSVALEAGIAESVLTSLENYERKPSREEALAIAKALGLNGERAYAVATGAYHPKDEPSDGDDSAQVIRLSTDTGMFTVHSYLLVCRATGETAIVDTAANGRQALDAIRERGLQPRLILLTHGHGDHIDEVDLVQRETRVPVIAGKKLDTPNGVDQIERLDDGESVEIGQLRVSLRTTPGHTPACVTFVSGKSAFSGDVIFAGSLGRGNFSYDAVRNSAKNVVLSLPDDTRIYPGHGPSTTVGEEKAHNPFF